MIKKNFKKNLFYFFVLIFIFALDRLSKLYILNLAEIERQVDIYISPFLNLYLIWNTGIGFGLFSSEQSFYDALADNPSAQELMKEEILVKMARELAELLRRDATIDWQYKENVQAKLRLKIKTLLKRYKYPPDEQATAVDLVLQQAKTLGEDLIVAE